MKIYPAIDLLQGKVVRLYQGDYDQATIYGADPLEQLRKFEDAGVELVHVVDLDGAREGTPVNLPIIEKLVENSGVKIEVGGGIRNVEKAGTYLNLGVERVVIGTVAVSDIEEARRIIETFPGRVMLGIDVAGERVALRGWRELSNFTIGELIDVYRRFPVRGIIFTDISKDGTLEGVSYEALKRVLDISPFPVVASGGVSTIEDIEKLLEIKSPKLEGVIVGRAIYDGSLDLTEALKLVGEAE